MRLYEITPAGSFVTYTQQQLDVSDNFLRSTATRTVPLENGEYSITVSGDGFFGLYKSDQLIGFTKIVDDTIASVSYGSLGIIYIVPTARKSKAFLVLINAIRQLISKPILVDGAVFQDGLAALNALSRRDSFRLFVIDKTSGATTPFMGTIPQDHNKAIVVEGFELPIGKSYPPPGFSESDDQFYYSFVLFG